MEDEKKTPKHPLRQPGQSSPRIPRGALVVLHHVTVALVAGGAALALMGLVPPARNQIGPATVEGRAALGPSRTDLQLPPLGTISARTHSGPLKVTFTVSSIDAASLPGILLDPGRLERFTDQAQEGLQKTARDFGVRLLIAALIIGGLVAALLPGRHLAHAAAGAIGGLGAVAIVLTFTARSYNVDAFEQPRFTGSLERAPQVFTAVQKQAGSIDNIQSRFRQAAARLSRLLLVIEAPLQDPQAGTTAVLHISDIHSNPVGLETTRQLAERFKVKAIIDSGDLTSFGEPIEARVSGLLSAMPAPYLFVPGNHDSPQIRNALRATPNVSVLDKTGFELDGIKLLGWGDPTFTARGKADASEQDAAFRLASVELAKAVREQRPAVLVVHNPELASNLRGAVPLVLSGHGHKRVSSERKGTLLLQVGSTGATGLGSFLVESDLPYEAEILYFKDGRLQAYDYISLRGLGAEFEISRTVVAETISL